jgi:DNA-binding SARP family transcriptional activator
MRFAIMQGTPSCYADAAAAEEAIAGQEGTVLRLLILHRGRPLTKEEIARHLTRPGKRAVSPGSVPGYIRRLRKRIGPDRIRSAAGYSAAIDSADVDAFAFETLVETYDVCNVADVDSVAPEHLDMYEKLLDLHAMWKANPGLQFADDQDDEFLPSRYHDFERYWDCLRRCIICVELRSRRKPRIEKAISRLEQLLGQDPYDEQSWALLYRARASLPGGETAASSILARIREQFPGGIPGELRYTINRIANGHNDALFDIDRGPRSDEDQQRINQLVQTLGISPASELELRRSKLEPLECISQTVSQLRFAGILATKWVADSYVLARFTRLLERLDHSGGSVQFLLIDPESESYRKFSGLRWSPGSVQPMDMLRRLSAAHPSFAVRLYDALPTFRIVLIDQSIMSFSPYLMDPGTDRARTGWEAPHIVLDRTASWPLAHTFETLFSETWRPATPLLP